MKSKELKTYNLPMDNQILAQIDAKPNYLFFILICLGIVFLVMGIYRTYGVIMLSLSILALIYTPRVVMMEFYYDYLVIYNKASRDSCILIYYDEVSSWYYQRGANHDYLYIELVDGQVEKVEAFSKTLFESHMNRFMKDKRKSEKT